MTLKFQSEELWVQFLKSGHSAELQNWSAGRLLKAARKPFPSLFPQEVLWLDVPSSMLGFIYVSSPCSHKRCSFQLGVLSGSGGTFKGFSLDWDCVVIWIRASFFLLSSSTCSSSYYYSSSLSSFLFFLFLLLFVPPHHHLFRSHSLYYLISKAVDPATMVWTKQNFCS